MDWSSIEKAPILKNEKKDTPDGMWQHCSKCCEVIFKKDFVANQNVCSKCDFHHPISAPDRIKFFLDKDTFTELDTDLKSGDPLEFTDSKSYTARIEQTTKKTGHNDAFYACEGKLHGRDVQVGVFDFRFMGGSMGSVVGEKIARLFLRAAAKKQAAIIFSASGGARMQEGILSLMQMAKTCTALAQLREAKMPMISVLTNPTTGGVAASYAMLGDVNIAEPKALIGFAGPRVIKQTIGQDLPEGFQSSEYLLEHGMVDLICHRDTLRSQIRQILEVIFAK